MIIDWLNNTLLPYAHSVPLSSLAFIMAFFEELIPPIPGFTVMLTIGGLARAQDYQLLTLFILALFSASGKTLGAQIVYTLVNKLESVFLTKFGPVLNIKPKQLENFSKKLGHGARDYMILTALRAIPVIPSTVITIGSGLVRVPQRLFVVTTFIGTIFRDSVYLYIGYAGIVAIEKYFHKVGELQPIITLLLITIIILIIYYQFFKRRERSRQN